MAVAAVLTCFACPAGALAHGDPTAHYLETDSLLTTYAAPPASLVQQRDAALGRLAEAS